MCLLRRPLACSRRSRSTCYMTAAVALFLYSRARRTCSSYLAVIARVLSLSFCLSVSRRVSAGALFSSLPALRVSSLPALCSLCFLLWSDLVFLLLWSLLCFRLCSASVSSLTRLRLSLVVRLLLYIYLTMLSKLASTTVVS